MSNGNTDTLRLVLEAASVVGTLIAVFVTLNIKSTVATIKLEQAKNKADLVQNQTTVKEELVESQARMEREMTAAHNKLNIDLNNHNSALRTELAVHTALDEQRFHSVEKTMEDNNEAIKEQNKVLKDINQKLDRNYRNGNHEFKTDR
jgi:hypothetical protein